MCSVREDVINSVYDRMSCRIVKTCERNLLKYLVDFNLYMYTAIGVHASVNESVNQRKLNAIICKLRIQIDDETTGNIQLRRFETWKPKGLRSKRDCSSY